MLKLKRVELQGFKSFCDRSELRFNGAGIAAVVGPNGCGKSNLSDAISWVLGEQSAKSLRGSRMADVIFAGTHSRKPVGMASVTMTLVDPAYRIEQAVPDKLNGNGNGANGHGTNGHAANGAATEPTNGQSAVIKPPLPASPGPREVTITRRLYRSGESEYLIDGKHARLRDIQDLFMGTGLGPESYAIIEQGRIGQILSSRPQDRRSVIEEAAGISRFKSRRRLAEAKLEGARQNLARVFDILEEVGRQVNSLNRQAKKAERYKKLHAELIVELRRTLAGRYRLLERELAKTALDLNQATAAFQQLTGTVAEREREQTAAQRRAYELEEQLTATRARLGELKLESERARGLLESQARQVSDIELRLTQGETETRSLEQRLKQIDEQLAAHAQKLVDLEAATAEARAALTTKSSERQTAQDDLAKGAEAIERSRANVLRLLGEASRLNNELAQVDEYLASIERDRTRAEHAREESAAELARLDTARQDFAGRLITRRAELGRVTTARHSVETELAERKTAVTKARERLEELRQQTSRLRARKESLDEILSHRAYTTESVKRFFTAVEQGSPEGLEPLGVLADFVDVDSEFEKAAEEFLHDELEYILVKSWDEARGGIDLMRRELNGRATFLVHPEPDLSFGDGAVEPPLGPETGIVTRLSDVLRLSNGLTNAPAELVPRIARCLIAEDHEAARRLARQYPDFYFLLAGGICYHGHAVSGGKKSSGGPLALKRELRELKSLVQRHERELAEATRQVEALEAEITACETRLEGLRADQQGHEKQVVALETEARQLDEEHARATQRRALAQDELTRLAQEQERATAQREQFQVSIQRKEEGRQTEEASLVRARQALDELQGRVARLSEEHSALRVELAEREERRRSERNAQQRLEAQQSELARRQGEVAGTLERLGVERARLLESNIQLDARAGELTREIESTEQQVAARQEAETGLRERLAAMDEELKQLRQRAREAQEARTQVEVALAERRTELKYLEETAIKELNLTLQQLAEAEPDELDEEALAVAEERCDTLKVRIDNLGAVNPAALEEYEEAKQRYDFLNEQRQDLLDSIRDTEKAIKEIDVETRKRFAEAFEQINENFRRTFQTLFGGGVGEMRLGDPSNPGESGIDVVASPPGKRLQNVLLLSGGEKALTALALLMAIFQYQPSPFCVLDEVDAPLDETNINRMVRLLRGMSDKTQFVVITHAKSTMGAAESLYGVTMQEPGVSKLVSVKFQPPPEPPPAARETVAARPS